MPSGFHIHMATIYNTESLKKMIGELKLAPFREKTPNELADKVLPVYSINYPYEIKTAFAQASNATSATIMTTSTTADTYVISYALSIIKDATSTSAYSNIRVIPFGENTAKALAYIATLTLTAQNSSITGVIPIPMKIARGTNITVTNTTNVANINSLGTIQYFEVPD